MQIAALALALIATSVGATDSKCYGTVSNGRLENGIQLPSSGSNYSAYNSLGVTLGRNYVHSKVSEIVIAAYAAVASTAPKKVFVYGETGWASGGRIRPHKTHQNGTSVDFFVPVIDETGKSVPLPTTALTEFGYSIDFDSNAQFEKYSIDFEALGEHLFQLYTAAKQHDAGIALVIFDPRYMPRLFQTEHGIFLKEKLNFMQHDAWVRHNEHYHVDFSIPCSPGKN